MKCYYLLLPVVLLSTACSTVSHNGGARNVASADGEDSKAQCVNRAHDFVDQGTTQVQIETLCTDAPADAPNSPLVCVERSTDFTSIKLSIDQKIILCAGAPKHATASLMCLESLDKSGEKGTLDQKVQACAFSNGRSEAKLSCLGRAHDFVDKDVTLAQKVQLCTGTSSVKPNAPLVCFERSVDFTGVNMTSTQKVVLCAGAQKHETASLVCLESLDKSGEKATVDEEVKACSLTGAASEADLQCLGRAHDFVDKDVTLTQKKQLCTGAPVNSPNTPLVCYERADDLAGKKLTIQEKIDFCLKQKK